MADSKIRHTSSEPVEGDGVHYSGIVWFVVILTATVVFCQLLVWGMFRVMESRVAATDAPRAPLAAPAGALPPPPNLLLDEPANLKRFRDSEDTVLSTYGWIDRNEGTVRIPIDRAKDLLLERGLPVRNK
jgi:hypothetical protein